MRTSPATPPGLVAPTQRGFSTRLIGDVVVDLGFASREVVDAGVAAARATGRTTGRVLVESGAITSRQLARVVAERFGLDHADLSTFPVDEAAARLVPPAAARRYEALPIAFGDEGTLQVAVVEPANVLAVDDLAVMTGHRVRPVVVSREDLELALARLGGAEVPDAVARAVADSADDPATSAVVRAPAAEDLDADADAPVVRLVHAILQQAIERGASDVHFAPQEGDLVGQFRIDGVLVPSATVPQRMVGAVISRIKVMADLDIAEHRVPQDGRMGVRLDGRDVDLRVVTLPLVGGESVVLRVLDRETGALSLAELGMEREGRGTVEHLLARPHGALLVTGPTGSGKTTTLYSALRGVNDGRRSILTIEDPVELRMDGVKQMQVDRRAGVTFATGLASMLRADPDVVMVGEIRDRDAAQIAIEAALTGHLVLSTLHTNDAPTAITRLLDMGIEPFLVASAIEVVVAQRLARRLCADCRRPVVLEPEVLAAAGIDAREPIHAFEPGACPRCGGSGYRGRIGLFEVLELDAGLRELVLARAPTQALEAAAEATGMRRLRADGLTKVRAGITSMTELARVAGGG